MSTTNYALAACRDGDPRQWDQATATVRYVCNGCPIVSGCLIDAIEERPVETLRGGVWFNSRGRPTTDQRSHSMRPSGQRQPDAACGTESGYKRHRRLGEPRCDACSAAHSKANLGRERRKREAA